MAKNDRTYMWGLLILMILSSCVNKGPRFLSYNDSLKPYLIKNEANRGLWPVGPNNYVLWGGLETFDIKDCEIIGLKYEHGYYDRCRLSDLSPPFTIYKNLNSDTLYVEKANRMFYFKVVH